MATARDFQLIWELDSSRIRDRVDLHDHVASIGDVATSVLVPENHTGRAAVSSIVMAAEAGAAGMPAIACLNARDRNLLGLRRDLLTATFSGIDDVLLVYGDEPDVGERASCLTVRWMLEECRTTLTPLRVGVSSRLVRVPRWKLSADRIFAQVTYSIDDLLRWRDTVQFEGEILAGVMVVTSAPMARRLGERVPQLRVADSWIRAIERDPRAGVDLAVALIDDIRTSGAFSGVHVIAGGARDNLVDALQLARSSV